MNTKMTPGSWRISGTKQHPILVNSHGGRITYLDSDLSDPKRLAIAAVPELIEALQASARWLDAAAEGVDRDHPMHARFVKFAKEARAALRKAGVTE